MTNRLALCLLVAATLLAACAPGVGFNDAGTQIFPEPSAPVTASAQSAASSAPPTPFDPAHTPGQDPYPFPWTPLPPTAYPGQIFPPTVDGASVAGSQQAQIATATAQTALILQTETAAAAARPTSQAAATPLPPDATRAVVNSTPDCALAHDGAHCHDSLLGLTYTYPAAWGGVNAAYVAGETGHGYHYQFSSTAGRRQAGGASRDFSEGREGMLTDFSGFGPDAQRRPDDFFLNGGVISDEVQAQVVLSLIFPAADYVCDPGPSSLYAPIGIVAINLPDNPRINGFVFANDLLSDARWQPLANILGLGTQSQGTKCQDPAARQQFDAQIAALVAALKARTADADIQANVDALLHLAQSIRFD